MIARSRLTIVLDVQARPARFWFHRPCVGRGHSLHVGSSVPLAALGARRRALVVKLQQLVYVSTSAIPLQSVMDVADILEESARHNPANNVTGALAFTETRFVQLLEGSAGSIDALLLKLVMDPRHSDLIVIDRIPIEARSFSEWLMIAPVFTPAGRVRLATLVENSVRPIEDFRRLLLEMIDEQARAATEHFPLGLAPNAVPMALD